MPYQKFTKDIGIVGLTNLAVVLKGLIILSIITKLLGTENYGIWAQLMVTVSLIVPIATLGLPYTLVRFLAAEKNKKEIQEGFYSVISLIFVVGLIISSFLIFFSSSISDLFGSENPTLVTILAFIILLECLNLTFLNLFRAFQEMKKFSFLMLSQAFGDTGLIAVAVILGYGLLGIISALLIIRITIFLIMGSIIIKKIGMKIPSFTRVREYLSFGLPIIPGSLSTWALQSSDQYLIGYFLGATFVGYYAPGYAVGNILFLFIVPLGFVLPAILSKLFDENKINEVKIYLKYSLKYFLAIAIPSVFGLLILSKQLLTIFSTPEIASSGYLIVPFVSFGILLLGSSAVINQILSLVKKTVLVAKICFATAVLNLGLNFIFIPKFGILGAAFTTFIAYTLVFILTRHYAFREFRFEIDWKFVAKSVFASVLMALFIFFFAPTGLLKTILAIFLGVFIYGILIFLFKGFSKKEIESLKGFLKKIKSPI